MARKRLFTLEQKATAITTAKQQGDLFEQGTNVMKRKANYLLLIGLAKNFGLLEEARKLQEQKEELQSNAYLRYS